jgi:hypothetical protein
LVIRIVRIWNNKKERNNECFSLPQGGVYVDRQEKKAMERKPTLLQLRRFYNITSDQLARAAGLPLYQSYTVEVGGFTSKHIAERVLFAFSRLVRRRFTLADIYIINAA